MPCSYGSAHERRGRDSGCTANPIKDEQNLVEIAPGPVLAGFEGANDRVRCGVVMRSCVSLRGVIAAANVAAGETDAQVKPLIAVTQALLATVDRGWKLPHLDLIEVRARITLGRCCHKPSVASKNANRRACGAVRDRLLLT
jgi:hypothetical protein